jgi:ATP-dependent exoDNAse (exonuclease V) beta subunit
LVHAWFEQIEWLDEMDESTLAAKWAAVVCPEVALRERVEEEVRRCLTSGEVRAAMSRPSAQAELWREKRFEILLGNEWLSGTFDRVVIEPHQATISDFKTDKVSTPEAFGERVDGYRPQLLTYREVIHRMTGLPLSAIHCRLIFTHRCEVVEV